MQTHIRSFVALACPSIRRRQLSMQRERRLEATPVLDAISAAPRSQRDQGMLSVALELEARVR